MHSAAERTIPSGLSIPVGVTFQLVRSIPYSAVGCSDLLYLIAWDLYLD